MKTAIEQLIEAYEIAKPHTMKQTIVMMKHFLEEEEKQITEAYKDGSNYGFWTNDLDYFNEKYNK